MLTLSWCGDSMQVTSNALWDRSHGTSPWHTAPQCTHPAHTSPLTSTPPLVDSPGTAPAHTLPGTPLAHTPPGTHLPTPSRNGQRWVVCILLECCSCSKEILKVYRKGAVMTSQSLLSINSSGRSKEEYCKFTLRGAFKN